MTLKYRHFSSLIGAFLFTVTIFSVPAFLSSCDEGGQASCNNANFVATAINVKWYLNEKYDNGQWISSYDTCLDVSSDATKVTKTLVSITGPDGFEHEEIVSCTAMELTIYDDKCNRFPSGNYQATITFLNTDEVPLSDPVSTSGSVIQNTQNNSMEAVIPLDKFHHELTGTYMFDLTFDGATCVDSSPLVDHLSIGFSLNDTLLTDFSYDGVCQNENNVSGLPTGDLVMDVTAYDASNVAIYCKTTDIKVGAGLSNPVINWDITTTDCTSLK